MTTTLTGGCQCGRIRYTARLASMDAYLCHCGMCRRATGGVSIAFVQVAKAEMTWSREPDWYASSPIARRPFCSACGTPLGFEFPDSDMRDVTVGSFDDPSGFVPTHHFAVDSRLEHWRDTSHLPGSRIDENPNVVDRWIKATGKLP